MVDGDVVADQSYPVAGAAFAVQSNAGQTHSIAKRELAANDYLAFAYDFAVSIGAVEVMTFRPVVEQDWLTH